MISLPQYLGQLLVATGRDFLPLRDLLIELYVCNQMSTQEISDLVPTGPTAMTIRHLLKGFNIPLRGRGGPNRSDLASKVATLDLSEEEYLTTPLKDLERKYKIHYTTILRYARKKNFRKKRDAQ